MNPDDLSQELIQEIKDKKIKPKSKRYFQIKNLLMWIFGGLSLLLGALTVALILYFLAGNLGETQLKAWLLTAPFFWLLVYVLFSFLMYYNFKHTRDGYQYRLSTIMLVILSLSFVLGFGFYRAGWGARLDDGLYQMPLYTTVFNPRLHYWSQPEAGRLAGLITLDEGQGTYRLIDRENEPWLIKSDENLEVGQVVRLSGVASESNIFDAKEVAGFGPGRGFYQRPPQLMQLEEHHPGLGLCMKQCRHYSEFDNCVSKCRNLKRGGGN